MTLTSGSLGPSQCSSCLKTSRPFLMALTSAVLACPGQPEGLQNPLRHPERLEGEGKEP